MSRGGEGYIYIYKCIVGKNDDICKIGKTGNYKNDRDRLVQHLRTPYYGFTPYTRFDTHEVIATIFKVNNVDKADNDVKNYFEKERKIFNKKSGLDEIFKIQLSGLEIYNIDYEDGYKELYKLLKEKNYFIGIYRDGYSSYRELKLTKNVILDGYKDYEGTTKKQDFEAQVKRLKKKYKGNYPDELKLMLRDKKEFEESSPSHFKDCIDFGYGLVLDIHVCHAEKVNKLERLKDF